MTQNTDEKITEQRARQLTAQNEPDRGYDHWLRQRQEQDAKKAEEKAQERARRASQQQQLQPMSPETQAVWNAWFTQSFENLFEQHFVAQCNPVIEDIGEALAKDRRVRRDEDEAVVAEIKNWVEGKLETKILPRVEALEQRLSQYMGQASGRADALSEAIQAERTARENEVRTAVADVKNWASERPETKLLPRVEALEQRLSQYMGQASGRADALGNAIQAERTARENEVRTAVADVKDWASERPETKLLQRLETLEQQFAQHVGQASGRADALDEAVTAERTERRTEVKTAVEEVKHWVTTEFQEDLGALAERLRSLPGRLPVARTWQPECVVYEGQFVSHNGSLWQAKSDTATTPGGDAWLCVARAGRDARMLTVRGTYDGREKYQQLDIVAMGGGSFIAKYDNPGSCPGDGWQLMCKQGKTGRPGYRGPPGDKGEKGDPGVSTVSWQVDSAQYRVSPLMSDGTVGSMLDLHPLAQQLLNDVGKYYDWDRG